MLGNGVLPPLAKSGKLAYDVRMRGLALITVVFCALLQPLGAGAETEPSIPAAPTLVIIYGAECPHCKAEFAFLDELQKEYPSLVIDPYEVWHNGENAVAFMNLAARLGIENPSVPVTIMDQRVWVGFSDNVREGIGSHLAAVMGGRSGEAGTGGREGVVRIPIVGDLSTEKVSLPVLAVLLGTLDSFNPCAFFVLLFLLSLLIHAHSRTRMLAVGGIFVLVSGVVYFLFMAAWLNLFLLVGRVGAITTAAGAVALAIGAINAKDFFQFDRGLSLSIPDGARPRLIERMRSLLKSASFGSMLLGATALAVMANMYELLCTAGFPMVFTRALTLHDLPRGTYYSLLALYNVVYVLPLLAIVCGFVVTLGSRKLTEWQGRVLKLLSGTMMAALGGVLLARPELLNNVLATSGMIAGSIAFTALIAGVVSQRERTREASAPPHHGGRK
jgi:thiol-disulfide isomerase/thioredoxin